MNNFKEESLKTIYIFVFTIILNLTFIENKNMISNLLISRSWWLETRIVIPFAFKERIRSSSSLIPSGSSPLVGSSRIKNWGSVKIAIPIPSRCFIPNENLPAFFFPVFERPIISKVSKFLNQEYHIATLLFLDLSKAERLMIIAGASINAPNKCLFLDDPSKSNFLHYFFGLNQKEFSSELTYQPIYS